MLTLEVLHQQVRPANADIPDVKTVLTNISPVEDLLIRPGRAKRPKLIAVVIRGLPGSGKSLIARRLRDAEVEAGGSAPRIHCIDDYFVTARTPLLGNMVCTYYAWPMSTKFTLLSIFQWAVGGLHVSGMNNLSKHCPPSSDLLLFADGTFHIDLPPAMLNGAQSRLQEVEKEVWEKDASGKQRLKRVQETEYCYEADMEGAYACPSAI